MNEQEQAAPKNLMAKMSRVMGKLERLPKRGFNAHFKYKFVTDADVLDAVRVAMAEEGLCLFVSMPNMRQENKRTTVNLSLTFADGESGQSMTINWIGEANDTQDKGLSKAATSALKYALLKTFLIATGDDPDPDGGAPKAPTTKRKASQKPSEPELAGKTGQTTDEATETPQGDAGNGKWHTRHALIDRVREEIGYYGDKPIHIIGAMNKLAGLGKIKEDDNDEVVFGVLNLYAKRRADEKAASA